MSSVYSNDSLNGLSYRKSNDLVMAKYQSSLLENKLMALALTKMEVRDHGDRNILEARLAPSELRELISDEKHIYRDLKKVAKVIPGHIMFLEDGKGNFKSFSIVTNADYIDGEFIVRFNDVLIEHTQYLEKRTYTNYAISLMTSFERNSSFRIYEVLFREAYRIPKDKNAHIDVEYGLSELKFIIGLANTDNEEVKSAIANCNSDVDWDALYDQIDAKDKSYAKWPELRRWVILPAQKELEEKSNIRFEFEPIYINKAIKRIRFKIYHNTPKNPDMQEIIISKKQILDNSNNQQLEMSQFFYPKLFENYVGHNGLSYSDINNFISDADGNEDIVIKAIELADKQEKIRNYVGWIRRAIQNNNYEDVENIEVMAGSSETAKVINKVNEDIETGAYAEEVWKHLKEMDKFKEYQNALLENGITIEMLEIMHNGDYKMLTDLYFGWVKNKQKKQ